MMLLCSNKFCKGTFWMQLEDFQEHFSRLFVCRLYSDDVGEKYYRYMMRVPSPSASPLPSSSHSLTPTSPSPLPPVFHLALPP